MTTYYFKNPEEALKQVKLAGKRPGCRYGDITLRNGKKGWAVYRGNTESSKDFIEIIDNGPPWMRF